MALPFDPEELQRLLSGTVPAEPAPVVDPAVRDYVAGPIDRSREPTTRDELAAALAADRKGQRSADTASLIMQAGQSYANQRQAPREQRVVDDRMKEFLLGRQIDTQDAAAAAAKEKAGWDRSMDVAGLGLKGRSIDSSAERAREERAARKAAAAEDRDFRAGESDKDRANRLEAARLSAASREGANEDRAQRREQRAGEEDAKRFISTDFTSATKPIPPPVQADLQKRASATSVVLDNAKQLESLLANGGPAVWGQRAGEMEMLANNIWTELKDIKNLGVLAGPDMGILQGIIADPTQFRSILNDTSRVRSLLPLIQKFQTRMKRDLVQRVRGYGVAPVEGGVYAGSDAGLGDSAAPSGKAPRRTDPDTGETRVWNGSAWVPEGR